MNPSESRSRRVAVIAALLVSLIGLTIVPGFSCTHTKPDGTKTEVIME